MVFAGAGSQARGCTGYFKGSSHGHWQGFGELQLSMEPDYGPKVMDQTLGMCTLGAIPLVTNYNLVTRGLDMATGAPTALAHSAVGWPFGGAACCSACFHC